MLSVGLTPRAGVGSRGRQQGPAPQGSPGALAAWSVRPRSPPSWEKGFGHTSHAAQQDRDRPMELHLSSPQPPPPSYGNQKAPSSLPPTLPSIPTAQARTDSSVTTRPSRAPSLPTTQLPLQHKTALVNQCSSPLTCVCQAARRGGTQDCEFLASSLLARPWIWNCPETPGHGGMRAVT